ncbi:MAG: HAD-IB family hydrolase, partial [Acidimicrobiia bacterium]
ASVVGWPRVAAALGTQAPRIARDRDVAKELLLVRLLAGLPHDEVREAGRVYARTVRVRPEMRARLEWHRQEGHDIVIVSASLEAYLSPLAPRLGVGHVIGCTFVSDERGVLTGELAGGNVRGPEKARRLQHWLGGEEARAGVELWAYGDSSGDDELLAMADHATRVGSRDR